MITDFQTLIMGHSHRLQHELLNTPQFLKTLYKCLYKDLRAHFTHLLKKKKKKTLLYKYSAWGFVAFLPKIFCGDPGTECFLCPCNHGK